MAGIVFVRTTNLQRIVAFYTERIGMKRWLSQPSIEILSHDNFLVGFHESTATDSDSLLTFFYESRDEVDAMYRSLADVATSEPKENTRYRIYNFFGADPDRRRFEVQTFLHELPPLDG
jgi:catechol 2,3-dioxygenase-like lactoylglutathione lyase family enzyme